MQSALSYVSGASEVPLLGQTIGQALDLAARRWSDLPALISPSHGVAWTWREFRARVGELAAGLLKLGLRRGERIGVWSLNRPEWALTQFAAAEAGGWASSSAAAPERRSTALTRSISSRWLKGL